MATRIKPQPRRSRATPEAVLYLYGITQGKPRFHLRSKGVDGEAEVEAVPCAGLVCWVSRVDAAEFGESLARNMEDLEWLAAASIRHQAVVGAIAGKTAVLPARFGAVFTSEASLAADVKRRHRQLLAIFKKTRGADEWGVKVLRAPAPAATATQASSGREYLARRAALRTPAPRAGPDPELAAFVTELGGCATGVARVGAVSGARPDLEWQAALLVPRARRQKLQRVLQRFAERWQDSRSIECTGPWPPYSFVHDHEK